MDFTRINDFMEYVLALFENVEDYIIFISSSDAHIPHNFKKHKLELLKSLGLKTNLQTTYRYSFLAVIDSGEVKIEQCSENKRLNVVYEFRNHKAEITSQGYNAMPKTNSPVSINIDGVEYAVNRRGLNIVVWDIKSDCVLDSVVFDTFLDDSITRKTIKYDFESLCNAYKLVCEIPEIDSELTSYFGRKISHNKLNGKEIYEYLSNNALFLAKTRDLIKRGVTFLAFEHTNVNQMTEPTEWEKICCNNSENGFLKRDLNKYFEISGMSKIYDREIFEEILRHPIRSEKKNGYFKAVPQVSKYVNVNSLGQRPTQSFPEAPYNTIHIFGNSIGCTWEMEDRHTLTNQLQELVKDKYCVVNYSIAGSSFGNAGQNMLDVEFETDDIVIFIWSRGSYAKIKDDLKHIGVSVIDLFPYFNAPHSEEIFFDFHHPNPNGYKIIANVMNDKIRQYAEKTQHLNRREMFTVHRNISSAPDKLTEWLKKISKLRLQVGSIVMNCNPFTLGHRYLIEQSAAKVDKLFIFVVEEDKSIFPFTDRIELVRNGTEDLANVTVLPSGNYIISSLTFTDYFEKSEHQDRVIDPSLDVELFGAYIAPALGINIRFAGEEPLDNITRQYNETMAKILPRYGVKFEEIPRKEQEGEVISASRVRKLLDAKDFGAIAKIVPKTTYNYLLENYK